MDQWHDHMRLKDLGVNVSSSFRDLVERVVERVIECVCVCESESESESVR